MVDSSSPRARRTLLGFVTAAALIAGFATISIVPGDQRSAVITVSRFGDGVRLLAGGVAFSPWPLASRRSVERLDGAAVVAAQVDLPLASGARVPATVRLSLYGNGPLPVSAVAVRRRGWDTAWSEWLQPRLGIDPEHVAAALHGSEGWREIFPAAAAGGELDVTGRLADAFQRPELRRATVLVTPNDGLVRSSAREELRHRLPPRGRLVVIGLDALDWHLVDELVARGEIPNIAALMRRGLQATVRMRPPLLSPLIWTTIATGQPPEVHGVLDFVEPDPSGGAPRPVSSGSRLVPTLWEIGAAAGRTTAVIGWWATFPASAPPGCTIYSDRLSEQLMGLEVDLPGLADPPEALEVARRLAIRGSEITPEQLAPLVTVSAAELAAVPEGPEGWDDPIGGAARLMAATLTVQRLTERELERGTEIVLSYLEGTDTVGHLFGPYRPPALSGTDPRLVRRFASVVDRYHALVDAWIGRVAGGLRLEDTLVILSDHGFTWGDDRPHLPSGAHTPTAVHWHRPDAAFLVVGPEVRASRERRQLDVLEITPCLLGLAGLPPDAGMPAAPPAWIVPPGGRSPVVYAALVPPAGPVTVELPPEAREEELAKLRALGYLGGEEGEGGSGERASASVLPTPARTAIPGRLEARRLHNLGLRLADTGDNSGAADNFRRAIAADPTYPPPHLGLSRLLRLAGGYDEADAELWTAIDLGVGDPPGTLLRVAAEYRGLGQPRRAGAVLARASELFPDTANVWLDLGTLAGEQGDYPLAAECLARAAGLDPDEPLAHRNLAAALIALGDRAGARRALTRALALEPGDEQLRYQLQSLGGPLE